MFNADEFAFIRCDEEPERVEAFSAALVRLTTLYSWAYLKKHDRLIEVHETGVSRGAGTPNLTWIPIITVTEITITRDNAKTYSYKRTGGYGPEYGGKLTKGYAHLWRTKEFPDGWHDNHKCYIVKEA